MKAKILLDKLFKIVCLMAAGVVLAFLAWIVVDITCKSLPSLNLEVLAELPKSGGRAGGILNAIVGSIFISGLAILIVAPISLLTSIFIVEYGKPKLIAKAVSFSSEVLAGIPSIIFGFYGFVVFVLVMRFGLSVLSGALAIAALELPIAIKASEEALRMVPQSVREASLSLGATRWQTAIKVVTRQALPSLVTANLLAFARGMGEAAPLLFTSGYSNFIPSSLWSPSATLPLAVYYLISTPFPEAHARAYVAAFILIVIVLAINWSTRLLSRRVAKFSVTR